MLPDLLHSRDMKQCWSDQSGATIIEFALVAPVFFLLMMAIMEFGMIGVTQVAVESAVAATAREASIGKAGAGGDRVQYVRTHIRNKLENILDSNRLVISANTVLGGGVQADPDICMDSPPRIGGACNPPLAYEEVNGIPGYQDGTGVMSLGSAGDLIEVRVFYPWRVHFPVMTRFFGNNGVMMITANAIVKNEAF